jgi:hypothetical protein
LPLGTCAGGFALQIGNAVSILLGAMDNADVVRFAKWLIWAMAAVVEAAIARC